MSLLDWAGQVELVNLRGADNLVDWDDAIVRNLRCVNLYEYLIVGHDVEGPTGINCREPGLEKRIEEAIIASMLSRTLQDPAVIHRLEEKGWDRFERDPKITYHLVKSAFGRPNPATIFKYLSQYHRLKRETCSSLQSYIRQRLLAKRLVVNLNIGLDNDAPFHVYSFMEGLCTRKGGDSQDGVVSKEISDWEIRLGMSWEMLTWESLIERVTKVADTSLAVSRTVKAAAKENKQGGRKEELKRAEKPEELKRTKKSDELKRAKSKRLKQAREDFMELMNKSRRARKGTWKNTDVLVKELGTKQPSADETAPSKRGDTPNFVMWLEGYESAPPDLDGTLSMPGTVSTVKRPAVVSTPKAPAIASAPETPAVDFPSKAPVADSLSKSPAVASAPKTPDVVTLPKIPNPDFTQQRPAAASKLKATTTAPQFESPDVVCVPKTPTFISTPKSPVLAPRDVRRTRKSLTSGDLASIESIDDNEDEGFVSDLEVSPEYIHRETHREKKKSANGSVPNGVDWDALRLTERTPRLYNNFRVSPYKAGPDAVREEEVNGVKLPNKVANYSSILLAHVRSSREIGVGDLL